MIGPRSMRFHEEDYEFIMNQPGKNFSDKFHKLCQYFMKGLKAYEKEIEQKKLYLDKLILESNHMTIYIKDTRSVLRHYNHKLSDMRIMHEEIEAHVTQMFKELKLDQEAAAE